MSGNRHYAKNAQSKNLTESAFWEEQNSLDFIWGVSCGASSFATAVASFKSVLDAQDPNCATEFNWSGGDICTIWPRLTNWERYLEVATNGYDFTCPDEMWAYVFEAKPATEGSLSSHPNQTNQYPDSGATRTYFDNLWS